MSRGPALALLVALTFATACGSDLPDVDCAAPVPTYAEVHAFPLSCNACHSSTLTGASRFGAPAHVNFDTEAAATPHAHEAARRVFAGEMPLTGSLSAANKTDLYGWALCPPTP